MPARAGEDLMVVYYAHVLSPLLGLTVNVVSQLLSSRYAKELGLLKSVLIGFFCGFTVVIAIESAYFAVTELSLLELLGQLTLNSIIYGSLGYCYFHFINLGETARRVRIVRELFEFKNGLTMHELCQRYNSSEIINARLERMMRNKQIVNRGERYYIGKPVMLYIAKAIVLMKLVLLKKRGEFA